MGKVPAEIPCWYTWPQEHSPKRLTQWGKKRFIATANISLNEEVVKAGLLEDTFTMTSW